MRSHSVFSIRCSVISDQWSVDGLRKHFLLNWIIASQRVFSFSIIFGFALLLAGCRSPNLQQEDMQITVNVDGQSIQHELPAGSNVEEALERAGIEKGESDRVEPPLYTLLADGEQIQIVRVSEIFETEEEIIPFERQIVRNESLPEGETRLIQLGQNGLQEITYRSVYEDGIEISDALVKTVIVHEAIPEITNSSPQLTWMGVSLPSHPMQAGYFIPVNQKKIPLKKSTLCGLSAR